MIKYCASLLLLTTAFTINSQDLVNDSTKAHLTYFMASATSQCYSSPKIERLIPERRAFAKPKQLADSTFKNFSAYQHFVYALYYPESYYQSCSMLSIGTDYMHKIQALLPRQGEGLRMSKRQRTALRTHRDSTIMLMKECILEKGRMSDDFKRLVLSLQTYELIPTLIETIENQKHTKDPYILTTLCLLMHNDYEPFTTTRLGKKLYPIDDDGTYNYHEARECAVRFTKRNYQIILQYAQEYYTHKANQQSVYVKITGGHYLLGEKGHDFNPPREVKLETFHISRYEITNKQFAHFVKSTGYVTLAEGNKDAFVFRIGLDEFEWIQDSTANWRFPNGKSQGGIEDKMDHPVTCISIVDAEAYCKWADVRLPTIEEWEVASLGPDKHQRYCFGNEVDSIYTHANIWHGKTHLMRYEGEDYITTSPVGSYKPNSFGLYDVYGNVFEFCANTPASFNQYEHVAATRGGSWWCSLYACGFFNSIDIGRVKRNASFSNNGFRVVL